MGRADDREQRRDWLRLSREERALVVLHHGIEAVPASERWRWAVLPIEAEDQADAGGRR